MVVDSVSAQDLLHYSLKLLNYDPRIYQYGDLPTPPWQGRGQLPTVESLSAPTDLRGVVRDTQTVVLVWLNVPGAAWYEVEISPDGENWQSMGRANVAQMTVSTAPGEVHARVRAASDTLQSAWAVWQGDTTVTPPAAPVLTLDKGYSGGSASISWQPTENATTYAVALRSNGQAIYTASGPETTFDVTPEVQEGGPYRCGGDKRGREFGRDVACPARPRAGRRDRRGCDDRPGQRHPEQRHAKHGDGQDGLRHCQG